MIHSKRYKEGQIVVDTSCSVVDIQNWLTEISVREDYNKRRVLNDSQFEVVKLAAECICHEMDASATDDYESCLEPFTFGYAWRSRYRTNHTSLEE